MPRSRGFTGHLLLAGVVFALLLLAAVSLTTAAPAGAREPAQTAQLDDGAAAGRAHWGWIRGWLRPE